MLHLLFSAQYALCTICICAQAIMSYMIRKIASHMPSVHLQSPSNHFGQPAFPHVRGMVSCKSKKYILRPSLHYVLCLAQLKQTSALSLLHYPVFSIANPWVYPSFALNPIRTSRNSANQGSRNETKRGPTKRNRNRKGTTKLRLKNIMHRQ